MEPATATSATTDLVRRHAEAELRAQSARSEAAQREAAEQAAREKARTEAAAKAAEPQYARRVGLVNGSFDVYVDLLEPATDRRVFRLFGPDPDKAPPPAMPTPARASAPSPALASQAYAAGAEDAPLPGRALATEA